MRKLDISNSLMSLDIDNAYCKFSGNFVICRPVTSRQLMRNLDECKQLIRMAIANTYLKV